MVPGGERELVAGWAETPLRACAVVWGWVSVGLTSVCSQMLRVSLEVTALPVRGNLDGHPARNPTSGLRDVRKLSCELGSRMLWRSVWLDATWSLCGRELGDPSVARWAIAKPLRGPSARFFAGRIIASGPAFGRAPGGPFVLPQRGSRRAKCIGLGEPSRGMAHELIGEQLADRRVHPHVQRRDTCEPTGPYFGKESGVPLSLDYS